MEFTVCIFEGLLNTLHIFNDIQRSDQIHIYHRGIANQTNDGMIHTAGNMGADAHAAKPYLQVFNLFFLCVGFQYYYHNFLLLKKILLSCFLLFLLHKLFCAARFSHIKEKASQRISLRSSYAFNKKKPSKQTVFP